MCLSFIYRINNSGSSTDPWGTPYENSPKIYEYSTLRDSFMMLTKQNSTFSKLSFITWVVRRSSLCWFFKHVYIFFVCRKSSINTFKNKYWFVSAVCCDLYIWDVCNHYICWLSIVRSWPNLPPNVTALMPVFSL